MMDAPSSSSSFTCCFRFIRLNRRCRRHPHPKHPLPSHITPPPLTCTPTTTTSPSQQKEEEQPQLPKQSPHHHHNTPHQYHYHHPPCRFSWDEMVRFTSNFSRVIGSGGFSTVYLSQFPCPEDSSRLLAIKIIHGGGSTSTAHRLHTLFKHELDILLRLRHDNIVKLLGYSDDPVAEEGVLVLEYVPNGNLQQKLHPQREDLGEGGQEVLSWKSRMKIAYQLAQVLEYLHHKTSSSSSSSSSSLPIVHGDIKPSNILLDHNLNCKLCDFGSAKMGFSSSVISSTSSSSRMMRMVGSPGYTDPHYLRTGIPSKKNDIYSFGVVLQELLTGKEAICSRTAQRLTPSIVEELLMEDHHPSKLLDPRLLQAQHYDWEQVKAVASISARCLSDSPALRPSAPDILNAFAAANIPLSFSISTPTNK